MKHLLEIGRCRSASITSSAARGQAKGPRCRRTSAAASASASATDLLHDSTGAACTVGTLDLLVQLPCGQLVTVTVERRTPMLDVLVRICTRHNLQPSEYTLQPVEHHQQQPTEKVSVSGATERTYRCKPSTQVGLVGTRCVRVVPKAAPGGREAAGHQVQKQAQTQAPFEPTHRLQVHLPRHQLYVTRVGGRARLADILRAVCLEKRLDPDKYIFRHPVRSEERLDLNLRIGDYQLTEVYLVGAEQMPRRVDEEDSCQVNGGDGGAFHSMPRKARYSNGDVSPQLAPLRAQARGRLCASYTDLYAGGAAMLRKKRPAPTPPVPVPAPAPAGDPQPGVVNKGVAGRMPRPRPASLAVLDTAVHAVRVPVAAAEPAPAPAPDTETETERAADGRQPTAEQPRTRHENGFSSCHSRNSSDSSGYHEASLLSDQCVTPPLLARGGSAGSGGSGGESPPPPLGHGHGRHWPRYDQNYNSLCCINQGHAKSVPNLAIRSWQDGLVSRPTSGCPFGTRTFVDEEPPKLPRRKKKAAPPPPILRKESVISTTSSPSPTLVTSQVR